MADPRLTTAKCQRRRWRSDKPPSMSPHPWHTPDKHIHTTAFIHNCRSRLPNSYADRAGHSLLLQSFRSSAFYFSPPNRWNRSVDLSPNFATQKHKNFQNATRYHEMENRVANCDLDYRRYAIHPSSYAHQTLSQFAKRFSIWWYPVAFWKFLFFLPPKFLESRTPKFLTEFYKFWLLLNMLQSLMTITWAISEIRWRKTESKRSKWQKQKRMAELKPLKGHCKVGLHHGCTFGQIDTASSLGIQAQGSLQLVLDYGPQVMVTWSSHTQIICVMVRDQPNSREKMPDFTADFLKCVTFHGKFTEGV